LSADVKLPPGFDAVLPGPIKLDTPFGRFAQSASRVPGGLRLDAFFSQPQRRVGAAEYQPLVDFSVAVDRAESRAVELARIPPKAAAVP
jgi:hypothetical protein